MVLVDGAPRWWIPRKRSIATLLGLVVPLAVCPTLAAQSVDAAADAAMSGHRLPGPRAEAGHRTKPGERELLAADSAFARATERDGARGWASWFLPDGEMIVPGLRVRGRDEILATMLEAFADPAYALRWEPLEARVSEDGTLGYTSGPYRSVRSGADGDVLTTTGTYVSVWERNDAGRWRVRLDVGLPDPEAGGGS